MFERALPYYMAMGMTLDEYWDGDNALPAVYRRADEIRQERLNESAWLQGVYFYNALCCASPLFRDFVKAGARLTPYPEKPYPLKGKEEPKTPQAQENLAAESAKKFAELAERFNAKRNATRKEADPVGSS